MKTKRRTVGILVADIYQDLEVWYPYLRLKEEGHEVVVIGERRGETYKGKYGYPIASDISAEEALKRKFDAIVIPGGYAPDVLRRSPKMVKLVRDVSDRGGIIAAICHGPWMLVSADVLHGKRATCFFAIKDDVKNAGAKYVDKEVVLDGNIVTSRKPEDLPAFCKAIIQLLETLQVS
jgi:protease I